jgi:hypothetical protein
MTARAHIKDKGGRTNKDERAPTPYRRLIDVPEMPRKMATKSKGTLRRRTRTKLIAPTTIDPRSNDLVGGSAIPKNVAPKTPADNEAYQGSPSTK